MKTGAQAGFCKEGGSETKKFNVHKRSGLFGRTAFIQPIRTI